LNLGLFLDDRAFFFRLFEYQFGGFFRGGDRLLPSPLAQEHHHPHA